LEGYYDVYSFNGTDGQVVSFEMRPTVLGGSSNEHTARLILIGPDGDRVADSNQGDGSNDDEAGSAQIERWTLEETGTYTLIAGTPRSLYADSYDSEQEAKTATFDYQLRFYESAGSERLLAYGEEVNGDIGIRDNYQDSLGGYFDAYSLSAMEGDTVSLRMLVDNPDEHTAHVVVLDPTGTQIAETDTNRGSAQLESLSLTTTGVYEIVATTPEPFDSDTYDSEAEAKNDFFDYQLEISGPSNNPPTLTAKTSAKTAAVGETVTLSTSAVDPNGDTISYTWTQRLGLLPDPEVDIRNANSGTATFVAPEVDDRTELVFEVTAVDGNGGEVTDSASVIVDPSLNGTPNQSSPKSLVVDKQDPNAYDTIQAAVDAASDGETVEARPGTYPEQVVLNKDITLLAPNGATLDGSSLSGNTTGIQIPTDSSASPTIEEFTITGYTDGIDTSDTSGAWTVRNVTIQGVTGDGVDAFDSTGGWTLRDIRISGTNQTGVEAGFSTGDWTISDSRIQGGNQTGVSASFSEGNWVVRDTVITDNRLIGIGGFDSEGDWLVRDSTISNNGLVGVDGSFTEGDWTLDNSTLSRNGDEVGFVSLVDARFTNGTWTVRESKLTNPTGTGAALNATDASSTGDATQNWWGAEDGPSGDFAGSGVAAVGNVTVKPYYTDSALTSLSDAEGSLTAEDIDITAENNFEEKGGQGVLKTLFEISEDAIPLPNTGPEEQQSYIDSNVTVEIDDASSRDIERVSLTFEARGQMFGGGEAGRIPYESDDTYRAQNLRVSAPTQVKITQFKRVMAIISSFAPGTSAPLESGIRQDLEAYPDVSITSVNIEFADGSTTQIEVDKQLPRFTDTCQDPLLSMELRTYPDPDCKFPDSDQDAVMVLSPARIVVEDEQGRQTGRIRENGEYKSVSEIPGSFYSGNRSDEFVLVPDGGNYSVNLIGTGEGNATVVVDDVERSGENATVTSTEYQNITVSESTQVTTGFSNTTLTVTDDNGTRSVSPDRTERISPGFSVAEFDRDGDDQIGFDDLRFALREFNNGNITFDQLRRILRAYNTGESV
jgi:hypothetical protein